MSQEKVAKKSDFLKVLISAIAIQDGFNVREEMGDIDALAKSIAKIGQKVPIVCSKVRGAEEFLLTAGHRRLAAIKLANEKYGANIDRVDVMIDKGDDETRNMLMLLDGEGSKPLTNQEMVKGIKRLIELGVPKKEIVDGLAMGLSPAQRYNLVKAAEAPEAVQKMIEAGLISVAKVNALQREAKSDKELVSLAEKAIEDKSAGKSEKKVPALVQKLMDAVELNPKGKGAKLVTAIANALKDGASAEEIAELLK